MDFYDYTHKSQEHLIQLQQCLPPWLKFVCFGLPPWDVLPRSGTLFTHSETRIQPWISSSWINMFIWGTENGLHLFIQINQKLLCHVIIPVLFSRIGIKVTEDEANVIREQLCVILLAWVDLHRTFDLQQSAAAWKLRAKQKQNTNLSSILITDEAFFLFS